MKLQHGLAGVLIGHLEQERLSTQLGAQRSHAMRNSLAANSSRSLPLVGNFAETIKKGATLYSTVLHSVCFGFS